MTDLKRDIGLPGAVGVGLGAIIGAGIFVVTGLAAGAAGPSFLAGLAIAGVAATCNALSSAQLAATYPRSGGTYEYGHQVLRPWVGFAAGWMFLVSKLAAGGTVALGFGGYLHQLVPAVPARTAAVAAAVLLTAANCYGIKKVGRLNAAVVTVTIFALLHFVVAGASSVDPGHLRPFAPRGWSGIMEAAALLFFAYTGYARIATLGEEVAAPKATIPRAIILSLGISLVLYAAVAFVAVGTTGAEALSATTSPLTQAARRFERPGAVLAISIGAATAMLGVLLSQMLGISRMMFAMARKGDLPAALGRVSAVRRVPDRGILLSGSVIVLLCFAGTIAWVAAAASFTILLYYGITNVAALRMARRDKLFPGWVSVAGLIFCAVLALSLRPATIAAGLALLTGGLALRWILRRAARDRPPAQTEGTTSAKQ